MNWWVAGIAVGLFVWAFAEAYVWPVVPDAALASAVFLVPEGIAWFAAATVVGSAVGGATAMAAYRRGMRWPLPLVTPRMRSKVAIWLDRGAVGLVYQPLTTVPYKVFVVEGGGRSLGLAVWTLWTVVFRGARMSVVALLAVLASGLVKVIAPIANARLALLGVGLALFLMGWRAAWQFWARSEDSESVRPDGMAPTFTRTMQP